MVVVVAAVGRGGDRGEGWQICAPRGRMGGGLIGRWRRGGGCGKRGHVRSLSNGRHPQSTRPPLASPTSPLSVNPLYHSPRVARCPRRLVSPLSSPPHTTTPLTLIHVVYRTTATCYVYIPIYTYVCTHRCIHICIYERISPPPCTGGYGDPRVCGPYVRYIDVARLAVGVHVSRTYSVVQLYFRMSWIYRAREVAEHEVYSLCHYRRFNEFQALFRRRDNQMGGGEGRQETVDSTLYA